MLKHLSALLLPFFFVSCSHPHGDNKGNTVGLRALKYLEWSLGYAPLPRCSGTYADKTENTEYLYFADITTLKCVDIATIEGEQKWHIPLTAVFEKGDKIRGIQVVSPDTILVLSNYTNQLYVLNRTGEIWKHIDLQAFLASAFQEEYELVTPSFENEIYQHGTLLLGGTRLIHLEESELEGIDGLRNLYAKANASPVFFQFSNLFSETMEFSYGLKGYVSKHVCGKDSMVLGKYEYCFSSDKLIKYSEYTNQLHEVSTTSLAILDSATVTSTETNVGCQPLLISDENLQSDAIVETRQTRGCMVQMVFDHYRNLYYLSVKHDVRGRTDLDDVRDGRGPWSLMVYNSNLELLNEILMPEQTYAPENLIVCKQGLLIGTNRREYKTYEYDKAKYELFEVVLGPSADS